MNNKKTTGGFTLIELLVSISIIAILTSLLTANFIGARQRGRDGQRKANLFQMQSALELYRSDTGAYPTAAELTACGDGVPIQSGTAPNETIYMQKIPCDPMGTNVPYKYIVIPDPCDNLPSGTSCTNYTMYACLENKEDSALPDTFDLDVLTGCDSTGNKTYPFKLTNP